MFGRKDQLIREISSLERSKDLLYNEVRKLESDFERMSRMVRKLERDHAQLRYVSEDLKDVTEKLYLSRKEYCSILEKMTTTPHIKRYYDWNTQRCCEVKVDKTVSSCNPNIHVGQENVSDIRSAMNPSGKSADEMCEVWFKEVGKLREENDRLRRKNEALVACLVG